MDRVLLEANHKNLLGQYSSNIDGVLSLQATLINDMLPGIEDELDLDAENAKWVREWLNDTSCLFQILRRHQFIRSFAMESIRNNLMWRLTTLRPHLMRPSFRKYHILPRPDPLGRPIVVIKVSTLIDVSGNFKDVTTLAMDHLREYLKNLNHSRTHGATDPVLQYVVLLDVSGLSIQMIDIHLISWTIRDLLPRFPGMFAAVFMINYSWAHSGIWEVVRRVLPTAAHSRVIFPSRRELLQYFTAAALPKEYGGTLADPEDFSTLPSTDSPSHNSKRVSEVPRSSKALPRSKSPATLSMSPISYLNPFFGYPLSHSTAPHTFHAGRRRKRDLLRTLAFLWWARWRSRLEFCLWILFFSVSGWLWIRRHRRLRLRLDTDAWQAFVIGFGW